MKPKFKKLLREEIHRPWCRPRQILGTDVIILNEFNKVKNF
jgi:hypothetical protein